MMGRARQVEMFGHGRGHGLGIDMSNVVNFEKSSLVNTNMLMSMSMMSPPI